MKSTPAGATKANKSMKIVICGSMFHDEAMFDYAQKLTDAGYEVDKPITAEGHIYTDNLDKNAELKQGFIDQHFRKIDDADAILVVNETKKDLVNYIGGNSLMEMAYAYSQGLEIFLLNPVPDASYMTEINGMSPIVIDGDIKNIDKYFSKLPLVFISSESAVKLRALSRGFRRAGLKVRIDGFKVDSGVNEQPQSIEETYEGAINRQNNLREHLTSRKDVDYFATIESGNHLAHKNHNTFGCSVIILEKEGSERKIGIDLDVEFPRSMTDKVPSIYPDLGILVQQEYGSKLKDPFRFLQTIS